MNVSKKYAAMIDNGISSVYQTGVASKILQYTSLIRNTYDITRSRRWSMELLQNSGDASYENTPVSVRIRLTENNLYFSHNGRPFRVKDVLSIINQVSSKNDDGTTIGKFGTGFMSTLQLSECIKLNSVLCDTFEGEILPCKPFSIVLDRRGQTKEEIFSAIEKTTEELKYADNAETIETLDKEAYNTEFIYSLETEQSRICARTGTDDLIHSVLYILIFAEKTKQIEIIYDLEDKKSSVVYRRGETTSENGMSCTVISEKTTSEETVTETDYYMYHMTSDGITVAAAADKNRHFFRINEKTSRLFISYPLIGSENFPFPLVLNSNELRPDEPRKGITLVDNENSPDALKNKEIMKKARILCGEFFRIVSEQEFKGAENILSIPEYTPNSEISPVWVKEHIDSLYEILSAIPFIPSSDGKISVNDKNFVFTDANEISERKMISDILQNITDVTCAADDVNWYDVFKNYNIPENKSISAQSLLENAEEYVNSRLRADMTDYPSFCRKIYDLCMLHTETEIMIKAGNARIFPSQKILKNEGERIILHTVNEIKKDPGIPEVLKDAADSLDLIIPSASAAMYEKICIRSKLLHKTFSETEICENYSTEKLLSYISSKSSRSFPVSAYNMHASEYIAAWRKSWKLLISCCRDKNMYDLAKIIYSDIPSHNPLTEDFPPSLWKNTFSSVLNELASYTANFRNIKGFITEHTEINTEEKFFSFINCLAGKIKDYSSDNLSIITVFPAMNGIFYSLTKLNISRISYPEFIDIAESFTDISAHYNLRNYLLAPQINSDSFSMSVYDNRKCASDINMILQKILSSHPLSAETEQHQNACMTLLAWIDKNPETAAELFPAYSSDEDKMKLLTPRAAAEMKRRADRFEDIIAECGLTNPDELITYIKESKSRSCTVSSEGYSNEYDVFYGDDISEIPSDELEDILRKTGKAGEVFFFEWLIKHFTDNGYEKLSENNAFASLKNGDTHITISYPDASGLVQPGWDIRLDISSDEIVSSYTLYEVKTHTTGSCLKNTIKLSNEQMKKALYEKSNYSIALVTYDLHSESCTLHKLIHNPTEQIILGSLRSENGYSFNIK